MNDEVKKEVEEIIKYYHLNCSIKGFKDKIDWHRVSQYQTLSENFIREFENKVDWICISIYQKLSEKFIGEFRYKLDLDYMLNNNKITQELYDYLKYHKVKRYEILDI